MTHQRFHDPKTNADYYRTNQGFTYDPAREREHRVLWAAERLIHKAGPGARILDLGASDGYFCRVLPPSLREGYHGVELNEKAVTNAIPEAKGRIHVGDVMNPIHWPGQWDRVFIGEILEHLLHPKLLLTLVLERLNPGGTIATTSATGFGEEHEPGNEEHLREWTLPEYARLHTDAGFEILEAGYALVYKTTDKERYANVVWAKPRGA